MLHLDVVVVQTNQLYLMLFIYAFGRFSVYAVQHSTAKVVRNLSSLPRSEANFFMFFLSKIKALMSTAQKTNNQYLENVILP